MNWQWVEEMNGSKRTDGITFGRKNQLLFLQYGLFFLRECLRLKVNPNLKLDYNNMKKLHN